MRHRHRRALRAGRPLAVRRFPRARNAVSRSGRRPGAPAVRSLATDPSPGDRPAQPAVCSPTGRIPPRADRPGAGPAGGDGVGCSTEPARGPPRARDTAAPPSALTTTSRSTAPAGVTAWASATSPCRRGPRQVRMPGQSWASTTPAQCSPADGRMNDLRVHLASASRSRFRPRGSFELVLDGTAVYSSSGTELFTVSRAGNGWDVTTSERWKLAVPRRDLQRRHPADQDRRRHRGGVLRHPPLLLARADHPHQDARRHLVPHRADEPGHRACTCAALPRCRRTGRRRRCAPRPSPRGPTPCTSPARTAAATRGSCRSTSTPPP